MGTGSSPVKSIEVGDILVFFLCQHVLLFSFIFWFLTWASEYYYNKKNDSAKKQTYECGFKSLDSLNFQINLNFVLLCVFLLLYDVEFTFLLPIVFNVYHTILFNFWLFVAFVVLMFICLFYDWQAHSLTWQY